MDKNFSSKPMKMWIDGTCFNIESLKNIKKILDPSVVKQSESESTNMPQSHNFIIHKTESNISTSFLLASMYYVHLKNHPNFNLKKLELDTKTSISIPKSGEDGSITITGSNEADVVNARQWIHSVLGEIHGRERPTHFIGIPVHSEEVQRNFQKFKDAILNDNIIQGIDEAIFQSPLKLHLTIGVLALMGTSETEAAIAALGDCKASVVDPVVNKIGQLKIKVSGISCMNDNLSKVNVLYANAKIEENGDVLQKLGNAISDYFYERGLLIQYKDNVKLHVTLMNTTNRKPSVPNTPMRAKWRFKKQPFDATTIFEKYKDYYFGEKILDSIHLSLMSTQGEDGYYKSLSVVNV